MQAVGGRGWRAAWAPGGGCWTAWSVSGATAGSPDGPHGIAAAHGCALDRPAGAGWLAAGDAALACDPLSSQGLLNALYTGLAAAEAAHRTPGGTEAGYIRTVRRIDDAYRRHLALGYGLEQRWPEAPFRSRRRVPPAPVGRWRRGDVGRALIQGSRTKRAAGPGA